MATNRENDRNKDILVETLISQETFALIGAGCSAQCGYPTWKELLKKMAEKIGGMYPAAKDEALKISENKDLLWAASKLKEKLGDHYNDFIKNIFAGHEAKDQESKTGIELYCMIANMNFRHYLTINYDTTLEKVFKHNAYIRKDIEVLSYYDDEKVKRFFRGSIDRTCIFYLHGKYDNPSKIILNEEQYVKEYIQKDSLLYDVIKSVVTHKYIVLIGFGFHDHDFLNIFREVKNRCGLENEVRHFALFGLQPEEDGKIIFDNFYEKYGVRPVFYDVRKSSSSFKEDHGQIIKLLADIARRSVVPRRLEDKKQEDDANRITEYMRRYL